MLMNGTPFGRTRSSRCCEASYAHRRTLNRAGGFSLIEVLIVVIILGILAAIVFPKYTALDKEARAKTAASNAHKVLEMVQIHRNSGDYEVNSAGNPTAIHGAWFHGGEVPEHTWTSQPFVIEYEAAGSSVRYPATKTFDPSVVGTINSWYNLDNGRFVVLVPAQADDAETLALFNLANASEVGALSDTH